MQRVRDLKGKRERGASAIVVALTLLVLIGFTGFGVDVTSAYAKSQEVQNAADAAVLGTAQHCAQEGVTCVDGSQRDRARGLAGENVRLQPDTVLAEDTYPEANWVTVEVTAEHQNYFAGVFGFNSFTVVREATAAWGTPTSMTTLLPLTIGECEFNAFQALPEGTVGVINLTKTSKDECGTPTSGNVMPGGFGYIGSGACGDYVVDLNENGGWVPKRTGNNPPSCDTSLLHQVVDERSAILVPIFDKCRMLPNNDSEARCEEAPAGADPKDGYHIKGFAAIELHGFKLSGAGGGSGMTYPTAGPDNINDYCTAGNERCIRGRFVDWVDLADAVEWGPGPDYGVQSVRLIDPDHSTP